MTLHKALPRQQGNNNYPDEGENSSSLLLMLQQCPESQRVGPHEICLHIYLTLSKIISLHMAQQRVAAPSIPLWSRSHFLSIGGIVLGGFYPVVIWTVLQIALASCMTMNRPTHSCSAVVSLLVAAGFRPTQSNHFVVNLVPTFLCYGAPMRVR
jgi:hypothetical protein